MGLPSEVFRLTDSFVVVLSFPPGCGKTTFVSGVESSVLPGLRSVVAGSMYYRDGAYEPHSLGCSVVDFEEHFFLNGVEDSVQRHLLRFYLGVLYLGGFCVCVITNLHHAHEDINHRVIDFKQFIKNVTTRGRCLEAVRWYDEVKPFSVEVPSVSSGVLCAIISMFQDRFPETGLGVNLSGGKYLYSCIFAATSLHGYLCCDRLSWLER